MILEREEKENKRGERGMRKWAEAPLYFDINPVALEHSYYTQVLFGSRTFPRSNQGSH